MFEKAKKYQQDNTKEINHIDEFKEFFNNKKTMDLLGVIFVVIQSLKRI